MFVMQTPRMEESFTIHLGSQLKHMHNIRILSADVNELCSPLHTTEDRYVSDENYIRVLTSPFVILFQFKRSEYGTRPVFVFTVRNSCANTIGQRAGQSKDHQQCHNVNGISFRSDQLSNRRYSEEVDAHARADFCAIITIEWPKREHINR